jgi:carbon-monoxide dehydrogenase medium subunit
MITGSARLADALPALVRAAGLVGGRQTQTVGTIGGNIANASPAADLVPPLAVYDAQVVVRSGDGERSVPVLEFITGRRATALLPGELITAVDVPIPAGRTASTFLKVGRRAAMEISIASMAVRVVVGDDDIIADARIAVGACGPKPFRAVDAEAALVGNAPTREVLSTAGHAAVAAASPIDDRRGTARYRTQLIPRLLARAVADAVARAATVTDKGQIL